MEYWQGTMNWPIEATWQCETCGTKVSCMSDGFVAAVMGGHLEWGLVHAQCRCTTCHTQYMMRNNELPDSPVVTKPISQLRPEFKEPARRVWESLRKPLDEVSPAEWIACGVPVSIFDEAVA